MDAFAPFSIGDLTIQNRFMRSAISENNALENGMVSESLIAFYDQFSAQAELGLIETGHAYVNRQGKRWPRQLGAHEDAVIPGLHRLMEVIQKHGSRAFVQLTIAGIQADPSITGMESVGASHSDTVGHPNRAMTKEEILATVEDFGQAARRVRDAGGDGVIIHALYGYGISQFLSPLYNKRTDNYGGTTKNRARICSDIIKRIKEIAGRDFPVMVKINASDLEPGGNTIDDAIDILKRLKTAGVDGVECSGGMGFYRKSGDNVMSKVRSGELDKDAWFSAFARQMKEALPLPVALVGGIRSYEKVMQLLNDGVCDIISLARPLICEPDLIHRWKKGDIRPSRCVSCGRCLSHTRTAGTVACVLNRPKNIG